MAQVIISERGTVGNRQMPLVYDSLTVDEAKKLIDIFDTDDTIRYFLDCLDSVYMTFDSIDHGDGKVSKTICFFAEGNMVIGSDEWADDELHDDRRMMEMIASIIEGSYGIGKGSKY